MAEEKVTAVQHGTPDRAVLRVEISSSNLETRAPAASAITPSSTSPATKTRRRP